MIKFQLKQIANDEIIGLYDTKTDAIEKMNELIVNSNNANKKTQENGLSPFEFTLDAIETDEEALEFDKACTYLDLPNSSLPLEETLDFIKELNPHYLKPFIAMNKLFTIADAWNKQDNFTPDFNDKNQEKYYPWIIYEEKNKTLKSIGSSCTSLYANAYLTSRLCFKTKQRAAKFSNICIGLYNQIFHAINITD